MPHQASGPGLVPGEWARGRERNGVADGRPGQAREDLGGGGWGAADSTHFSPFPDWFFLFMSIQTIHAETPTWRPAPMIQPLPNSVQWPQPLSSVAMHRGPTLQHLGRRGDRLSDGARCARPKVNPFGSLPNCIQTGSGPTWQSATRRVLGGPDWKPRGLERKADMDFDVAALPFSKCHSSSTLSSLLLQDGCNPRNPPVTGQCLASWAEGRFLACF